MKKYKLLDLFCCAGGASMGYNMAGFEVTGIDIKKQPNYPFTFIQRDAIEVLKDIEFVSNFDAIHASPPCQGYSNHTKDNSKYVPYSQGKQTPKLIAEIRALLPAKPFVIENVRGAKEELINPIFLTGFMFGLPIERIRFFESNIFLMQPEKVKGNTRKYALENNIDYRDMTVTGKSRRSGSIDIWKKIMGMPWTGRGWELTEAIPPPIH